MKKFILALVVMLAAILAPSTQASATVPAKFAVSGWWDVRGSWSNSALDYEYPDYPVPCHDVPTTNTTKAAWVILWAVPPGQVASIPQAARDAVRRAGSIFAASAKRTVTSYADVRNLSLAPKWETSGTGDGNCTPQFNVVNVPSPYYYNDSDELSAGAAYAHSSTGLLTYLQSVGANKPNFKYLVLKQTDGGAVGGAYAWSDGQYGAGDGDNVDRGTQRYNGGNSFVMVPKGGWTSGAGRVIAHEMVHNMGGVHDLTPHLNEQNMYHVSDCGDIMCYGNGTPGETWNNGCGTSSGFGFTTSKMYHRLDCNNDDYFTPDVGYACYYNPDLTCTYPYWRVNISSFLWGNPDPATFPTGQHWW